MMQGYDSFNLKSVRQTSCAIFELGNPSIYLCWQLALIKPHLKVKPAVTDSERCQGALEALCGLRNLNKNSLSVAPQEPWAAFS